MMWWSKKKIGALLLTAALAIGIAGCGGGEQAKPTNGKTQITFWHVYSENFGAPVIKEMVDAFNKSQDKIEVKAVYNPDMYPGLMQNLQAEVAGGKYPSMVMIGYNYLKYFDQNFKYASPTTISQELVPADKDYLATHFMPNILKLAQVDGKQVGIPFSISAPILYYNADLYRAAGLDPNDPPKTWEQVREHAQKIKEATGNYGFYMQEYQDNWAVQGLLESNGAQMLSADGKHATFASPEAVAAYQLLADMVKDKSALHIAADEGIAAFSSGKVGILAGSSAKIGTISKSASFELRGAPYPYFEGKERLLPTGGNFIAITAQDPEQQKAAWEFLKFIMKDEWLAKWTVGTGYMPPRPEAREEEALKQELAKSEPLRAAFEEMDTLVPWVAYPGDVGVRAEKMFADTRDQILGGKATVEEALTKAQDELNKLLK